MCIWQLDTPSIEDGVPFCVVGKGKSEAHRRMEAPRDHVHPELHVDHANMGREAEDRASPLRLGRLSKNRS